MQTPWPFFTTVPGKRLGIRYRQWDKRDGCGKADDWLANNRGGCTLLANVTVELGARLLYTDRVSVASFEHG
jgi:hypothetical protein